ncbi:hypothetical protein [Paenibacillus pedocola]|uniref:hypothetical protein n=1 Tax=Paenibacillus pedocola TaxID=3242193 RepID=UPI002877E481|nr:hypothetical protein [Paenibacillus typhae]
MKVHYLTDIFQETNDGSDFLRALIFAFASSEEFLYLEYNIHESDPMYYSHNVELFMSKFKQPWFRPKSIHESLKIEPSFLVEAIVLSKNKDIDSWKFKLSVIESPETIDLKVTEITKGFSGTA